MLRISSPIVISLLVLLAAGVHLCARAESPVAKFSQWSNNTQVGIAKIQLRHSPEFGPELDVIKKSLTSVRYPTGADVIVNVQLVSDSELLERTSPYLKLPSTYNAFMITSNSASIELVAGDMNGLIYGADELNRIIETSNGKISDGVLIDYPGLKTRALHFTMKKVDVEQAKTLIDNARLHRFNTLVIGIVDGVRFDADAPNPRNDAISKYEFLEIVEYARYNGLEVVPHVPLLTHQNEFFKNKFPELMFNKVTYDPRKNEVYALVFEYLDELIELINPSAIHIGHDEAKGWTNESKKKWLRPHESPLPPNLFLQDVKKLNTFLTDKNIEVWMWGDMLIAPGEIPSMGPEDMNGRGGYQKILPEIPKNIVICDWRYYHKKPDFPSSLIYKSEGHPVLGSTWKVPKNIELFSSFMASPEMNGRGMIATTWFHVGYKEHELVNSIIEISGRNYWSPESKK
jgi:hypothetical protein